MTDHKMLECSRVAAGMWHISEKCDAKGYKEYVSACMENGINTFDHADIYGGGESERLFGQAWREAGIQREEMVLISKCGNIQPKGTADPFDIKYYDTSRDYILDSVDGILQRLETDYLDLLMIHRYDAFADYGEIASAFEVLKSSGKVRHFGVSNYNPLQFDALNRYLGGCLIANQVECSVFRSEPFLDGTFDQMQAGKMIPMAWSPLGGGFSDRLEKNPQLKDVLRRIADAAGTESLEEIALRWLMSHPAGIIPVIGTSKIDRMKEAVRASEQELSRLEFFAILTAAIGEEMP